MGQYQYHSMPEACVAIVGMHSVLFFEWWGALIIFNFHLALDAAIKL